jgi:hypothetical protein
VDDRLIAWQIASRSCEEAVPYRGWQKAAAERKGPVIEVMARSIMTC